MTAYSSIAVGMVLKTLVFKVAIFAFSVWSFKTIISDIFFRGDPCEPEESKKLILTITSQSNSFFSYVIKAEKMFITRFLALPD